MEPSLQKKLDRNGVRPTKKDCNKGGLLVGFGGTDLGAGDTVEAEQQGPKMNQVGMLECCAMSTDRFKIDISSRGGVEIRQADATIREEMNLSV